MYLFGFLLGFLIAPTDAGRWTGVLADNSQWFKAINQDIDLIYRKSLIMAIKGCQGADLLFYQYVTSGGFVYVRLGDGGNTYSLMMASPHCTTTGCSVAGSNTAAHLDCNAHMMFWFRWDNWGTFEVGTGAVVGTDLMMDMNYNVNGVDDFFELRTVEVSSSVANVNIEFYFYIDFPPTMVSPPMNAATIIHVPENTAIGTEILKTSGTDPEGDVLTFGVTDDYVAVFGWEQSTSIYIVNTTLDFETKKVYYVNLAAHDGFNVIYNAMTVFITDVDDENPVVTAGVTSILEELPIGTPLYGVLVVNDPDTDQTFTYSLTGTHASLFTVTDDVLTIAQRVDREAAGTLSVTVTVTDSGSNTGKVDMTLTVIDTNDNSPSCDKYIYFTSAAEGTNDENVKIMDALGCTDADQGSFANFTPSIVSGDTGGIFYFTGLELFGSPKSMDYEAMSSSNYAYYLTVQLTDQPTTGPAMTSTILVIVEVTGANEFDPAWTAPTLEASGDFPALTIAENEKHSTVLVTYAASDSDDGVDGDVHFEIVSIKDDGGGDGTGKFVVDYENGELRVKDSLDIDTATGGVAYYDIAVKAEDGGTTPRSVQATQRVTLNGVNDNSPLFTNAPVEVSVAEDAGLGDLVVSLTVSDADGDTVTLTVTGGATTEFTTSGHDLVTAAALDFETTQFHSVVLSATDGTTTTLLSLTVRVTDVNDHFPVITLSNAPMFEELPVGTVLYGLYTVTDPDEGDTFTYSVSGTDVVHFKISASGDLEIIQRVVTASVTLTVDVTVTDAAGHATTETVTIAVTDVNDNSPNCNQNVYDVTVKEGSGAYKMLLNTITCTDTDGSPNGDITIRIDQGNDAGIFAFSGQELWGTPDNIDYESLEASNYQYRLDIVVEDQPAETPPRSDNIVIIVTVTGDNEYDPAFTSPTRDGSGNFPGVSLAEDTAISTLVDTFKATDQDHGQDGVVQYQIVSITPDSGGAVTDMFWVDVYSGAMYVGGILDADTVSYYDVVVRAVDKGTTPRSVDGTVRITLTGVNDNAPVLTVNHDVTVVESAVAGDLVVEVTVTDADGDTPTLSLGGSQAGSFSVSGNQVLLQSPLDYDDKSKSCISLEVSATDGVHTTQASLTITVDPANDESPTINVNSDPKIMEEVPIGTVVWGIFTVSDPDEGDTFTYAISGTDGSFFTVTTEGGLTVVSRLDRESKSTLTITMTVEDAAAHSVSETITITVVDVNDNAPVCDQKLYVTSVEEANVNSDMKMMDAVTCSDADTGDNAAMNIAVVDGDTAGIFNFKSDWALWGGGDKINYEGLSASDYNYYLTAEVIDTPTGVSAHTGTIVVLVKVTAKNEFAPAFTAPTPDGSGNFPDVSLSEDAVSGSTVVTYAASDNDEGAGGDVFFEIVSITSDTGVSAPNMFLIDRTGGHLRVGEALDADTSTGGVAYYEVVVKAVDDGAQSVQHTQKIILTSVNDNPPIITDTQLKFTVAEDAASGVSVGTLGVTDYDSGDSVTLTVIGTHTAVFEGHASNPDIQTLGSLDYETTKCYSVEVSASDGTLDTKTTVTVAVTDVADVNPTLTPYTFVTMAEELPSGTVIGQLFELTDPDTQDSSTFTIGGTDGGKFSIDTATGRVSVASTIDADGGTTTLTVSVTAADSAGGTGNTDIDIGVIDINEFAPAFGQSLYTATVVENSASAKILDVVCNDADAGANGDVELVVPTTNGADTIFTVNSMELHADGTQLDYDTLGGSGYVYSFTLLCRDKPTQGTAKTGSVIVNVEVTGVDEFSPAWSNPVLDGSGNFPDVALSESVAPGTVVQTFTATDSDDGPDGTITYQIVSAASDSGADASSKFRIQPSTGRLETAMILDADSSTGGDSYYDIAVKSSDGTNEITGNIKVTLSDYSDNPPKFSEEYTTVSVACTTSVGATVLTLTANDVDTVGSTVFSLKGYTGTLFTLLSSGVVTLNASPTSLGDDIYHTLSVVATDSVDASLTDEATVYIEMEYCGPVTTTTAAATTRITTTTTKPQPGVCTAQTDDSAVVPMRVVTAIIAVALVGMLGFSLRSLMYFLKLPPKSPSVRPLKMKKLREYERPVEPDPEMVIEDMTFVSPPDMMAEEGFKARSMRP